MSDHPAEHEPAPGTEPKPATEPANEPGTEPAPGTEPEPGTELPNPAQPLAPTQVPEAASAKSFLNTAQAPAGFPTMRYHPVHGGIPIADPNELASLQPASDWFDSPEKADAARTYTEATVAHAHNMRSKLGVLDDAGHPIVRNSVQADEAIRRGAAEPL